MSDYKISASYMKLILIFCFLTHTESRYVTKSGVFSGFVLRSSSDDLHVAAAEPRPIIIENNPTVLPLIANQNAFSDSPISLASEKVEKILQRPLAFSYQTDDQSSVASNVSDEEVTKAEVIEIDQKPVAIDYKHLQTIDSTESDGGAGNVHEALSDEEESESIEVNAEISDHARIKSKADSNIEFNSSEDSETEQNKVHENHGGANGGAGHDRGASGGRQERKYSDGNGGKKGYGYGAESSGNGSFEKGGGQEHHSDHNGENSEKGEKGYEGHHYDEEGEKGHHSKEKHSKDYEEKGGEKKEDHHDHGYHAEHDRAEEGQKESKFKEYGDHSKGHSTKGQHNIHRKDEYEKKQEFYDESDEEDGFEKDGDYLHEDEYSKGGFERGKVGKGVEEENRHEKKNKHEKGGHYKEESAYKNSEGHNTHHDRINKQGDEEINSGGKEWSYSEGTEGSGRGGHKGGKHGHQHADETNVAIPIIKTDQIPYSQNIPELNYENKQYIKNAVVLYPPLASPPLEVHKPVPPIRVTYENWFTPLLTSIQKRSDENYGEGVKNDKIEEDDAKLGHKEILDSLFLEPDITDNVSSKEENVPKEYKYSNKSPLEESVESLEQYKDLLLSEDSDKSSNEVGAYSIYTLGNYTSPKLLTMVPKENQQIESSGDVSSSLIEDGDAAISEDGSKQMEVVSTSMEPIIVVEETHVI